MAEEAEHPAQRVQGGMLLFVVVVDIFICCLQENARVVALYEGKLRILEARENALLYNILF